VVLLTISSVAWVWLLCSSAQATLTSDAKLLIAGDTLFRRGVGRTDLWGGDQATIARSIKERLYTLDEAATVVTGHGPDTRLGDEMRENPFVRA